MINLVLKLTSFFSLHKRGLGSHLWEGQRIVGCPLLGLLHASPPIFDASMCGSIVFMQAFTQVFVSTKAHSPTKLACLAAMADMLLPVCNDSVTFFSFTLFAFPIGSTKQGGGP